MNDGLTDLYLAQKDKMTDEHEVIDQAVLDRGKGYSVFSIPPGVLFRPPESRLRGPQSVDLLSAAEKFGLGKINPTAAAGGIKRNNSILLGHNNVASATSRQPPPRAYGRSTPIQEHPPSPAFLPQRTESIERSPIDMHSPKPSPSNFFRRSPSSLSEAPIASSPSYRQQSPQRQYSPARSRKDSNVGMTDDDSSLPSATTMSSSSYGSNQKFPAQYSDGRRIDSGFESNHEDRFSNSSARNSSRSQKTGPHYSPPPVPPMPIRHGGQMDDMDPSQKYGNGSQQLEDELNGVYEQLREMSVDKGYGQPSDNLAPYYQYRDSVSHSPINRPPGPSSVSSQSSGPKIKIKVHYNDTRMLVVSAYISFHGLLEKIHEKFDVSSHLRLQYKDEDNELVLMIDQDDLDLARQISRAQLRTPKEGSVVEKLELWCID
jgi:hypothetical protein